MASGDSRASDSDLVPTSITKERTSAWWMKRGAKRARAQMWHGAEVGTLLLSHMSTSVVAILRASSDPVSARCRRMLHAVTTVRSASEAQAFYEDVLGLPSLASRARSFSDGSANAFSGPVSPVWCRPCRACSLSTPLAHGARALRSPQHKRACRETLPRHGQPAESLSARRRTGACLMAGPSKCRSRQSSAGNHSAVSNLCRRAARGRGLRARARAASNCAGAAPRLGVPPLLDRRRQSRRRPRSSDGARRAPHRGRRLGGRRGLRPGALAPDP